MGQDDKEIKIKAFETILEWAKQIITIAAATVVLSATFIKDIFGGKIICKEVLLASWFSFLLSILVGVVVVGALAAHLNTGKVAELDIFRGSIKINALIQVILFMAGMVLFIAFVIANMA